ncbi:MAG: HAD family phosphatase [Bryobacterales bacterium]|nr:HAD family phosphatase [Bryobacterales bacterium]
MKKQYEAILFDFDGVLLDTEPLHFACWREVMGPLGVDLDWPAYDTRIRGLSAEGLLQALQRLADPPLDIEEVRAVYPVKIEMFRRRVLAMDDLMSADVKHLIDDLSGYRLGVVSSGRKRHVFPLLERAGVLERFGAVICQEDVVEIKPAPEPYLRAAGQLGVTSALVVEDSEAGRQSGAAAGFDVLMVPECAAMPALVREWLGV